jgi:hypothetical protein
MLFSLIMGFVEKFCASELLGYLEKYHQKRVAQNVANSPVTKLELIDSFKP